MPEKNAPGINLGNIASQVCTNLQVPGCIVLTLNENGSIGMSAHGVNHYKANELLSLGIHINLGQHDDAVRAGAAGEGAQRIQRDLDRSHTSGGVS